MYRSVFATVVFLMVCVAAMPLNAAPLSPLADAAERGDLETVRTLLRSGIDANDSHADGMTALHWAAENGDVAIAEILIVAGANVESGTRIGAYTPLHIASRRGHHELVQVLVDGRADPNSVTSVSGAVPLHLAAASHDAGAVQILLAAGADANVRDGAWHQTPLMFAASANRLDNVKLLLQAGADYSLTSKVIDTVEMERGDSAANDRLVSVLAEFKEKAGGGADWLPQPDEVQGAIVFSREIQRNWPNVPDPACENTEDAAAAQFSRAELPDRCKGDEPAEGAEALPEEPGRMSYGERVGAWGGLTALLHAVRQGHADVAAALLDSGADIEQASAGDQTSPLLMAAINGHFDLALELLSRGADPNNTSAAGTGPLFAVIERQWAPWSHYAHPIDYQNQAATHYDLMKALLAAGAEPNIRLAKHLWYAEFTTTVLVPAGLQYDGATPFWRAAHALDIKAMRMLREYGADAFIPTQKIPERKRRSRDPDAVDEKEIDHSGLPPVSVGGPFVYPVHAVAGAGYGNYFMAHAHRHAPDAWLPAMKYLVEELDQDINLRDGNGYTPLHHAAARGDNEMVEFLIAKGADVSVISRKGQTTVDMANGPAERIPPFPETILLLESHGVVNNNNCVSC